MRVERKTDAASSLLLLLVLGKIIGHNTHALSEERRRKVGRRNVCHERKRVEKGFSFFLSFSSPTFVFGFGEIDEKHFIILDITYDDGIGVSPILSWKCFFAPLKDLLLLCPFDLRHVFMEER